MEEKENHRRVCVDIVNGVMDLAQHCPPQPKILFVSTLLYLVLHRSGVIFLICKKP